ncbi:NnrS family protein [Ochrobactrum sp. MYb379]|uniref:NnrS family protein n=1 Tax=Ochrobactrum sp. MYb379 TaxID=2745275 RepID=UPI00309DDF88
MTAITERPAQPLLAILTDEGFRLFFPLAALYAAIWPFQWVLVFGLDLPLVRSTPPALWHAHEMIFGAFGAALLGFLTTAVPEWTDTKRLQGRPLLVLATLWLTGRLVGFLGADSLGLIGALADLAWLGFLIAYMLKLTIVRRTDRLLAFVGWIVALTLCEALVRYGFFVENIELASQMLRIAGLVFLGLLGIALARITVPITNLVLDPTRSTAPFRPHPGRLNLAPGLIVIAVVVDMFGFSPETCGYVMIAAGAAFMDRVGEAYIGKEALRAEIIALAGSSALAGIGLLLSGAAKLGAPIPELAGVHVALMGGLGLGVLAVFCIAGLLHTHQTLGLPRVAKFAIFLLVAAVVFRILPDTGFLPELPGSPYALAAVLWASAFLLWLKSYWPAIRVLQSGDNQFG